MFKKMCLSVSNNIKNKDHPDMSDSEFQKIYTLDILMDSFIKGVYENTNFEGIQVNGKNFYELDNQWSQRNKTLHPLSDAEKDNGCDKYMIDYEYDANYDYDGVNDDDVCDTERGCLIDDDNWKFLINYGDDSNDSNDIDKPLFKNYTSILLINVSGTNYDHRGSDHFQYSLPFSTEYRIYNPTFKDFVNALYMIKSHKADKWYELYSNCQVQSLKSPGTKLSIDDIDKNSESNEFIIKLSFDHGS